MKNRKWNFLVYVHAVLLLWALLFVASLFISDRGKTAGLLAIGNFFFLFVNIPLAVFSFIPKVKDHFSIKYKAPIALLSVLNAIVGAIAWTMVILLMQSPIVGG